MSCFSLLYTNGTNKDDFCVFLFHCHGTEEIRNVISVVGDHTCKSIGSPFSNLPKFFK